MEVVEVITPAEIQNKEFAKSIRGYNEEEVDMFLDVITLDLEKLIKENINLKAQVATLEKEKGDIDGTDISVRETLETAKSLMDEISKSSEKRAKNLIRNAEMDAAIIIKNANHEAKELLKKNEKLNNDYINFRKEYKFLLEHELEKLDNRVIRINNLNDKDDLGLLHTEEEMENTDDDIKIRNVDSKLSGYNDFATVDEDLLDDEKYQSRMERRVKEDSKIDEDNDRATKVNIRYE